MKCKFSNKTLKTVRTGYLYANGKLVLVHEEKTKRGLVSEWVTIHETGLRCDFEGRLIMSGTAPIRLLSLAREGSTAVRARAPSLDRGSIKTKQKGIACGSVSIIIGPDQFKDTLHFNLLDGLISGDFTLQPEMVWREPENPNRWADYTVLDSGGK